MTNDAATDSLTDVAGIEVGHFTDARRPTGCTVVLAREGAVGGVDVRGAAPGTRETDLLEPGNTVGVVHAVLLAGGNVGAGAGATVGKTFGMACAMKGGLGSASLCLGGVTVGALVACNALGDVRDPETGALLAGARRADGSGLRDTRRALLGGERPHNLLTGAQTTLALVATDATLDKAQARRLAQMGHDGLARSIDPVHTPSDGDTVFALATGKAPPSPAAPDLHRLCVMAAEAVARATVRAVCAARGLQLGDLWLPAAGDLRTDGDRGPAARA